MTVSEASQRVASWLARPNVRLLVAGSGHVESVCRLLAKTGTEGNLVMVDHKMPVRLCPLRG